MKRITKAEFQKFIEHDYAEVKPDGTPYLLYMDETGATVWGPVEIIDQLTDNLTAEPLYPEAL